MDKVGFEAGLIYRHNRSTGTWIPLNLPSGNNSNSIDMVYVDCGDLDTTPSDSPSLDLGGIE